MEAKPRQGGRKLALIPLTVALLLSTLIFPRSAPPDDVPAPRVDGRELERVIALDHALAARADPLPGSVRELGSAVRAFNSAEVQGEKAEVLNERRAAIDRALPLALTDGGPAELVRLRAVQLEGFLAEVRRFEATGAPSGELDELAGSFFRRMSDVGWAEGRRVVLDDAERRVMFKGTWTKVVGAGGVDELALTTDENRVLYGLYFRHPHATESQRITFRTLRAEATDKAACARVADAERVAAYGWLLQKLKEYAPTDPSYPAAYARGIALFARHEYAPAAQAFQDWLQEHPDGAWSLRARNYRTAALAAVERSY